MDIVEPTDPSLGEAMAALASMEAADAAPAAGQAQADPAASANSEAERAASADPASSPTPKADALDGAPATEDSKTPDETKPEAKAEAKPEDPKAGAKAESKFAKNRARLEGSWKELNAEKATVRATAETLQAREAELAKREAAIQEAEAKAKAPKYSPEDYERAAEKFESQGKYDLADAAREQAKELREHPPQPAPTDAEAEAAFQSEQKQWWAKAATDFPAVAKQGSAENTALQALIKAEPGVLGDPKGLYYAARLVAAETSAARVPDLTKQVGDLSAKVKELQGKLAIPAEGSAPGNAGPLSFEQKSEGEQESELYQMAREVGPFN